ncbi:MAG: hypothetical protein ACRDOH_01360 [Streptosporangiaceae bacterium]
MTAQDEEFRAAQFGEHRPGLRAAASRMPGSFAEARGRGEGGLA